MDSRGLEAIEEELRSFLLTLGTRSHSFSEDSLILRFLISSNLSQRKDLIVGKEACRIGSLSVASQDHTMLLDVY